MNGKKMGRWIIAIVLVLALMTWIAAGCKKEQVGAQAVERIGFSSRDDSEFYNGADLSWYDGLLKTTRVAKMDGDSGALELSAPTAIATATPVLSIDSLGVSNLFEVRDAATPVFQVHDGGNVTGKVMRYATAGQQMVVGTSTGVTETVVANHGLTTVTFALCTLGEDVDTDAGDPVVCTVSVSTNVVTLKLWEDDWSAAGTAATVHWLVVGTP